MSREPVVIDFEIIWKKFNHTLSEDEEILLSEWLKESALHRHYFEEAKRYYLEDSNFNESKADTGKAWTALQDQVKTNKRSSRWVISLSAAAVVTFLLITTFLPTKKTGSLKIAVKKFEQIKPGFNQAQLILDDGSVLDLSTAKNLQLIEGGSSISIEGTKVQYSEDSGTAGEIKYNTLSVPRGGEFFLQLADGTRVWLNSETTLRYPVQFTGTERKVELSGEAYFEVTRDEKIPFLVKSGEQTVRVLGTEFNISSYKENPFTYTTLVKGSVEVFMNDRSQSNLKLLPNEQGIMGEMQITKQKVDPYNYVAWKNGRFVFEDQNLEEIMKTLSRWYNVEVIFSRDAIKNIRFTGNLPRYSDFDEVLKKIGKTNEVMFTILDRCITIN